MISISRGRVSGSYACYKFLVFLLFLVKLPFIILFKIIHFLRRHRELEPIEECIEQTADDTTCPEFAQIFDLKNGLIVGVEKLVMCPEETAIIRIVGEDQISKPYKRRVITSEDDRYFTLNDKKYYLKQKVQVK